MPRGTLPARLTELAPAPTCSRSPLAPAPVPRPAPAEGAAPPRVLLVEDDALQARALGRLLRSHGALCDVVPSAEAALLCVASMPPYDLILSDLHLLGAPGTALAERLRRPLLVCYTGAPELPPAFDVVLRKPAPREVLRLLGARRHSALLAEVECGAWQGRLREAGLTCYERTPAQLLRALARALEAEASPPGHA